MIKVKAFVGPMFSGKTYTLKLHLSTYPPNNRFFLDPYNTRNSERDLRNNGTWKEIDLSFSAKSCDIVAIDECHLWDEEKLISFLDSQSDGTFLLAGLLFDFYKGNQVFPIWSKLMRFIDVMNILPCRNPCKICGSNLKVIYSVPKKGANKISNDYYNVCTRCINDKEIYGTYC